MGGYQTTTRVLEELAHLKEAHPAVGNGISQICKWAQVTKLCNDQGMVVIQQS